MVSVARRTVLAALAGAVLAAARAVRAAAVDRRDPRWRRWVCTTPDCTPHVYDPVFGDPDAGIPAGTPFADLPDDWACPVCGSAKKFFDPYD
jgi:rubredoxin